MLQPVTISPVRVRRAAPDLEARERARSALRRAARARPASSRRPAGRRRARPARVALHALLRRLLDDPRPARRAGPALHLLADLQHLAVVELLLDHARRPCS